MSKMDHFWRLRSRLGVDVCVRPDLRQMTTYVLLEQEAWFEAEVGFVVRLIDPGCLCLDIGANHGVYALHLAAAGAGQVLAFEPTRRAGECLQASMSVNGFSDRIRWVHAGLSDRAEIVEIATGMNSELSMVGGQGEAVETVRLVTLDDVLAPEPCDRIAFVKLDAEGMERRIVLGGKNFFSKFSPIVMFEFKGHQLNYDVAELFE